MKYWVYKESRILGPFDKDAVSGLPGLDSGTLVCAGDPAGNSWVPAGELADIAVISALPPFDDPLSSVGLLDRLQIDSAGLIGDEDFSGSFAEELFQDASFKKGFGDALSARSSADDAEVRRSREKISELTAHLEVMYRRISELEAGQTSLAGRLAEKDRELRLRGGVVPPSVESSPIPVPAPAAAAPEPAPPPPPQALPDIPAFASSAVPVLPSAEPPAVAPVPAPVLPPAESPAAALVPEPAPAPQPLSFGKPKSFKTVPTIKSFKVLGADEAAPASSLNPVPELKFDRAPLEAGTPASSEPIPVMAPTPTPAPAPIPTPAPAPVPTPELAPPNTLSRSQPVFDLALGDMAGPFDAAVEAPAEASMAQSAAAAASADASAVAARFARPEPAPTAVKIKKAGRSNKAFLVGIGVLVLGVLGMIFMRQSNDDLKQMAALNDEKTPIGLPDDGAAAPPPIVKPKIAETPPAVAPPAPGPSAENAAAIALVKDFPLDGGRGTVGRWLQYSYTASPDAGTEEWNASSTGDNTVLVEYRLVPGASGGKGALYLFEVDPNGVVAGKNVEARQMLAGGASGAIALVKDFPLDGDRGTVGRWLQRSYAAGPGSGAEEWSANSTGGNTLVEYRLVPGASGGKGALYLFEVDPNGLVMGKNIETRRMLAGGVPPGARKGKKKPAKKASSARRSAVEEMKDVPLLPLPDSGELRPPAEDDGTFASDTVNSGL